MPTRRPRRVTPIPHLGYHASWYLTESVTMRDVVVIGGGLSGLSACYELEKRQIACTVIEVKRRFGGGIRSTAEAGFVMDASAFLVSSFADETLLHELELGDHLLPAGGDSFTFRDGTESIVRALSDRLQGGRLMRMAVSSIGRLGGRYTICLENGIMLDAGALILAVPARYAARMLYNLATDAAESLQDYRYDSITRLSLGYHKRNLPQRKKHALDMAFPFVLSTDQPGRVPDRDHQLIQVGLRCSADLTTAELVRVVSRYYGWGANPIVARMEYWAEADALSCYDDYHHERIRAIRAGLPDGISLIGSDYCDGAPQVRGVTQLEQRLRAGQLAAENAIDFLKARVRQ